VALGAMAFCGCGATLTPLAEYARSLKTQPSEDVLPMHFPMYTVALHTLLGMSKVETHEQLKAQDLLVEFRKNTGQAAFLSHEWLDIGHPDAECKQMRVLQDALKHMMGNLHSIPVDLASEGFGEGVKPLPTSKLSGPLFFWYDYFSCPQMDDEWSRGVLLDAINSIPAYVDECSFFFALVPVLEHPNHVLTPSSWHHRGWCRRRFQTVNGSSTVPFQFPSVLVAKHVRYPQICFINLKLLMHDMSPLRWIST